MFKTTHKAIQAHKKGFKIINDSIQGMRTKTLKTPVNYWDNMTEVEKYAQDQDREQENEYQDNLNLV